MSELDPIWKKIDDHGEKIMRLDSKVESHEKQLSSIQTSINNCLVEVHNDLLTTKQEILSKLEPFCQRVDTMHRDSLIELGRQEQREKTAIAESRELDNRHNRTKIFQTIIAIIVGLLTIASYLNLK